MSYDIFCYRSKSGNPNEEEADEIIETDDDKWSKKEKDAVKKMAAVKALVGCDPELKAWDFHYGDITQLDLAIIEAEAKRFNRIQIDVSEYPELSLTVYNNHVLISLPYGCERNKAEKIFDSIKLYVNTLRDMDSYFVVDPQTGACFDPNIHQFDGLRKYLSVT